MKDIKNKVSISGFGGGYEETCQQMLQNGYDFLLKKGNNLDLKAKTFENIYGILTPESKDCKALEKAMMKDIDDCTGAMHQAVMSHLLYIYKHGVNKWLKDVKENRRKT